MVWPKPYQQCIGQSMPLSYWVQARMHDDTWTQGFDDHSPCLGQQITRDICGLQSTKLGKSSIYDSYDNTQRTKEEMQWCKSFIFFNHVEMFRSSVDFDDHCGFWASLAPYSAQLPALHGLRRVCWIHGESMMSNEPRKWQDDHMIINPWWSY